jgi:hypothetical protein
MNHARLARSTNTTNNTSTSTSYLGKGQNRKKGRQQQ